MRVFLTGFMGSGKSYVGLRLAGRLGYPFLDLDQLVAEQANATIPELFERIGESSFRDLESSLLRELDRLPMFVLATGGGTPCFHDNMRWMNAHGTSVFLDVHVDILERRLKRERESRPLLGAPGTLDSIIATKLAERRDCYEQAKIQVVYDNPKQDLVRLVEDSLNRHLAN